jgi:hypothetical protein
MTHGLLAAGWSELISSEEMKSTVVQEVPKTHGCEQRFRVQDDRVVSHSQAVYKTNINDL